MGIRTLLSGLKQAVPNAIVAPGALSMLTNYTKQTLKEKVKRKDVC